MHKACSIDIEHLKRKQEEEIQEELIPGIMEVEDDRHRFVHPIVLKGKATLHGQDILFELDVATVVEMPCLICNQWIQKPIHLRWTYTQPIGEVGTSLFDYTDRVREAILLELPMVAECPEGCLQRKEIDKYLHHSKDQYYPFKGL